MIQRTILCALMAIFLRIEAHADYYPRNWNVDILHYTFDLRLTDENDMINGNARIEIFFKDNTEQIYLDLIGKNASGRGMMVSAVWIDKKEITFRHENNRLLIIPEMPFEKGQKILLEISYEGTPADGLIISKNKFGDRTFFGDNWPDRARHWLPSVDHPSDKAGVDWIITAPYQYEVIGNGKKIEESLLDNSFKLTHWQERVDISTKVMVIGVAKFAVQLSGMYGDIPVEAWVYPQNREEGFYDYYQALKVIDYFDSHIGPYSYEKLANVQSKTRYGGMENASNIFYTESSVTGKRSVEGLIAHEIAHQWFGNSATEKDWHHVWLSEGFATYFTHLYMEHTYGVDALKSRMMNDREVVIGYYNQNQVPVVNTTIRDYNKLLNRNSYQKGGWVLHLLRKKVGDEAFWEGIQNYYLKYQNSNALTEDFMNEMENVSNTDLDSFFKQWIYTAGQPDLLVNWEYNSSSEKLDITIEQQQKEGNFTFPLEIGVTFADGHNQTYKAEINETAQSFSFDCSELPASLILDPDVELLFTYEIEAKN